MLKILAGIHYEYTKHDNMNKIIHRSMHSSPELETTQVFLSSKMDKYAAVELSSSVYIHLHI